jgi:hypothetical protein
MSKPADDFLRRAASIPEQTQETPSQKADRIYAEQHPDRPAPSPAERTTMFDEMARAAHRERLSSRVREKAEEERDVAYARIQAQQYDIDAAEARVAELKKALWEIATSRKGLDLTDTDEERINHWSRWATEYRRIAAAALETKGKDNE